jgi:putative tRNA adenosine deaminase-associated protein
VAYFTAVVARTGRAWRARDVELDDGGGLEELADVLRAVAVDDEPVIAVLEHEDEWFALFRVDGDDDPRLFVSDLPSASRTAFAELLAPAAEIEVVDDDAGPDDACDEAAGDSEDAEDEPAAVGAAVWAGDVDILEDLGVPGTALRRLVEEHDEDPAAVIADVGERVGFAELLEALR